MKKNFQFIFFVLLIGMLIGTMISQTISFFLSEGVVKNFFLLSKSIGFGATENNWIDFGFIRLKLGLFFDISIVSIIGLFVSWYLLRYFK
tara:strand:+ start:470 stop:739 length:270 start_codon:yes stop_codon:yes gene_type:complete